MILIITTTFQGFHSLSANQLSQRTSSQLSTVMVLVAQLVGQDCDAGCGDVIRKDHTQIPFKKKPGENSDARIKEILARASSMADPTSWVIVKNGTDDATYYLKFCKDAKARELNFTNKAALHHSRVYAIVEIPNHTPCARGEVTKAPTRIVDGVDQAWAGEHTRFTDDVESNFRIIDQCYTTRGGVKAPTVYQSPEECMVIALQDPTIVGFSYNYKPSAKACENNSPGSAYFITKYYGDDHPTTYNEGNPNGPKTTNSKRWTHHCLYLKK